MPSDKPVWMSRNSGIIPGVLVRISPEKRIDRAIEIAERIGGSDQDRSQG
jgi:hypothetical protein